MRKAIGFTVGAVFMIATAPFIFLYKIATKIKTDNAIKQYLYKIGIGMSQYYATFLYETEDLTTSSNSFLKQNKSKAIYYFRVLIDMLMGKNHCEISAKNELKELKRSFK